MKNSKNWVPILSLLLLLSIYASPANDSVELTAALCQFSDIGLTCTCPEEALENRDEMKKLSRKIRGGSCGQPCSVFE